MKELIDKTQERIRQEVIWEGIIWEGIAESTMWDILP